jgi:hypothetical protein
VYQKKGVKRLNYGQKNEKKKTLKKLKKGVDKI